MKKNSIILVIAIALSGLFFLDCFMFPENFGAGKTKLEKTKSKGFAVVELFTSEGCSSCPPADDLMGQIQQEIGDQNVYLLAFHVDYWNQLGWKDRFSAKQYSNHQLEYQQWLNLNVIYTPQFIINGHTEFAGYSKTSLDSKIETALETEPAANITLSLNSKKDSLQVNYRADKIQPDTKLFLAVVQKKASTQVLRGENKGALLHHPQIVREASVFSLVQEEATVNLSKPAHFNTKDWEVIGFVQNNSTGIISAAAKANFENTPLKK